ncbi:MAG TPA: hypothetical protein VFI09_11380 [Solirubrobacterales bacterium]|nr:hypothetical protein [Solirubrobacterales bacterium]
MSRDEVLEWEARRAAKVCEKLGIAVPADVLARRDVLVARKLELGHDGLERLLARELRLSAHAGRAMAALARGRRRLCTIELSGSGGSAEAMPGYYKTAMETGDEAALLAASPDHYVLCEGAEGVQQVIETTGGSPFAARIFLDESDTASVTTRADPEFSTQWVSVGRVRQGGPPSGAIRHQFADHPNGFRVRLTGEFPAAAPARLVRAHKWHLACEFSNWIEAANVA